MRRQQFHYFFASHRRPFNGYKAGRWNSDVGRSLWQARVAEKIRLAAYPDLFIGRGGDGAASLAAGTGHNSPGDNLHRRNYIFQAYMLRNTGLRPYILVRRFDSQKK